MLVAVPDGRHLTEQAQAAAAAERVGALEAELRRAKRREEKLAALQFRLREDLRACGGDVRRAREASHAAPKHIACILQLGRT